MGSSVDRGDETIDTVVSPFTYREFTFVVFLTDFEAPLPLRCDICFGSPLTNTPPGGVALPGGHDADGTP